MSDPGVEGCEYGRGCRDAAAAGTRIARSAQLELLRSLRATLRQTHAVGEADELLFRIGRNWGESVAAGARPAGTDARSRVEFGLREFAALGLGIANVDACDIDGSADGFRLAGRVHDLLALDPPAASGTGEREQVCSFTIGFLSGLASGSTGLDLVCSPLDCARACDPRGCSFEIRPAHAVVPPLDGARERPPAGSARFFLATLGASLGDGDLSLGDLIENTIDAIVLIDDRDIVRFWNRGAERMFQFTREEVVGRRVGFILPKDLLEQGELEWIRAQLAEERAVVNYATRRVRKDGTELSVELTRTVLHDRNGGVAGSTAIIRDVTAQRRAEAELRHRRELALVGELAAKVAHQIKNPLAGISATIQLLSRKVDAQDSRRGMFDDVLFEIRRLDEIVKDLLRYARPAAPRKKEVELQSFLGDLLQSLDRHPQVHAHQLVLDAPQSLSALFDPGQMFQVLENLVLNAAEAMPERGSITLRAHRDGDEICLEVEDSGAGIPAADLERIFEPFFTTKSSGSGLGLAIARKHVESNGGTLVAARGRCGGALFRIRLPLR